MARQFDPRDPRFRRSLTGRPLPRRRPTPRLLHGPPPQRGRIHVIVARVLVALILLTALLTIAGAGGVYAAYAQLAHTAA